MHSSFITNTKKLTAFFIMVLWLLPVSARVLVPDQPKVSSGLEINSQQAILIDAGTQAVLYEKEADTRVAPSSMSKMMTIYVVFDMLSQGSIKLSDQVQVSQKAWKTEGSRTFLNLNSLVTIEELLRGVIVQSGNDAAVALAEGCGGTESGFVDKLNQKAQEIGLKQSMFMNATGLPDADHLTTMRDLAQLCLKTIQKFPQYYPYYKEREFTYNNITQPNRNPLLWNYAGCDGLKTGHTDKGGFGVAASAVQGDRRLILVINGNKSMAERAKDAEALMSWGFRYYVNKTVAKKNTVLKQVDVWQGKVGHVSIGVDQDVIVTMPRIDQDKIKVAYQYDNPLKAPIAQGQVVGQLMVTSAQGVQITYPLKAQHSVELANWFLRMKNSVYHLLWGHAPKAA